MANRIVTSASRKGKAISVYWRMLDEADRLLETGTMTVDVVPCGTLDYSQSPAVEMTQEQRIQLTVAQVVENLSRQLKQKEAAETDGDLVVQALHGLQILS